MAISPRFKGDTGPQFWTIQDSGGNILPLTGATFVYLIYNPKTNIVTNGTGSFSFANGSSAANGQVTYATGAADVATVGQYQVSVQCNLLDGTKRFTLPQQFNIVPLFTQQ